MGVSWSLIVFMERRGRPARPPRERKPLTPGTAKTPLPAFVFNDTATTEIYTLSLHDALPIWRVRHDDPKRPLRLLRAGQPRRGQRGRGGGGGPEQECASSGVHGRLLVPYRVHGAAGPPGAPPSGKETTDSRHRQNSLAGFCF